MPGDIRKGIMALGRKARCGTLEAWLETELADASLELESSCAALYQRTEYYHTVSRGGALTRRQCEKELEEKNSYVENE